MYEPDPAVEEPIDLATWSSSPLTAELLTMLLGDDEEAPPSSAPAGTVSRITTPGLIRDVLADVALRIMRDGDPGVVQFRRALSEMFGHHSSARLFEDINAGRIATKVLRDASE